MKIKHGDKGFHFTTESGYVLSVQYGAGNYCENQHISFDARGEAVPESEDCEIAIWMAGPGNQPFLDLNGDQVANRVPIALIPQILVDLQGERMECVLHTLQTAY